MDKLKQNAGIKILNTVICSNMYFYLHIEGKICRIHKYTKEVNALIIAKADISANIWNFSNIGIGTAAVLMLSDITSDTQMPLAHATMLSDTFMCH